jgi:hypothetical protein
LEIFPIVANPPGICHQSPKSLARWSRCGIRQNSVTPLAPNSLTQRGKEKTQRRQRKALLKGREQNRGNPPILLIPFFALQTIDFSCFEKISQREFLNG